MQIRNAYPWVTSLYFMQGLTFALIMGVAPILLKNFNMSNAKISFFTSLYLVPWLLKPLLSPLLEPFVNKKKLVITMQLLVASLILLLAYSLQTKAFVITSSVIFLTIAFCASAYDTSSDGFYITNLSPENQAHFVGIRTVFYHLGSLASQGALIIVAGYFIKYSTLAITWKYALIITSASIFILTLYHYKILPDMKEYDFSSVLKPFSTSNFSNVFQEFFKKPNLFRTAFFVFIYNFPYAQLNKIVPLFLLDKRELGGLGINTEWVGIIYGTLGVISMMFGIITSGLLLTKSSLKYLFFWLTLIFGITNIGYLLLSLAHVQQLWIAALCIMSAQFGFGLCNGAYMVYLLRNFSKGKYSMSLYAIGTTLMILGMIIAGSFSGYLQTLLGYTGFFIWILVNDIFIIMILNYKILPLLHNE